MSRDGGRIIVAGDRPRIALIRLGAMGDCIYTLPLVSALKARFPDAELAWIVEAQHQEIPRLHPGVDEVIAVDTKRWRREMFSRWLGRMAGELGAVRRSLKAGEFDIALDPQGLIKSGAIAWLTDRKSVV